MMKQGEYKYNTRQDTLGEEDLLEPRCYPDATLFRDSLERPVGDEELLRKNLIGNKATLRALAPYLQIMYKDQKRQFETVREFQQKLKHVEIPFTKIHKMQSIDVVTDLSHNDDLISSIVETGNNLMNIIKAEKLCIYLVDHKKNELYCVPNEDWKKKREDTFEIKEGTTMAAYVAFKKDYVISNNVGFDPKFPRGLGISDPLAKYGVCVPIKTPADDVVAVYEFTRDVFSVMFTKKEIQRVLAVTGWIGAAILQKAIYVNTQRRYEVMHCLQQLSFHYHCSLANKEHVLSDVVIFARETTEAEHCSFYLILQTTHDYLILEEYKQESERSKTILKRYSYEVVRDSDSYLYRVLKGKETLNIYGNEIDKDNCQVRSILCAPIQCSCNEVLGAIQLTNKKNQENFSKDDEQTLTTFCSFVSISLFHTKNKSSVEKMEIHRNVIRNILNYHIKPCNHDEETIKSGKLLTLPEDFFTFSWYPSPDDMPRLTEITISMFHEVLGDHFMIANNVPKFILTVQKCYRPNPYHNFLHAFAVTHTMANIITRYHYVFNGLERKGLMVAAICHDVDHRGYTNNFIQLTKHYLSNLYTSSPLENHHSSVAKMIIQRCSMFSYLKPRFYDKLITGIHKYIIATDLSLYFQCRLEFMRIADEKTFTFKDPHHRQLVLSLIMTTCDLSGQTKPIDISSRITEDVYEEFFQQGDIEKKMGYTPLPTMDRDKKDMIYENQVQFLSVAVIPCIETVSRIFTVLHSVVEDTRNLLRQWEELGQAKERTNSGTNSGT